MHLTALTRKDLMSLEQYSTTRKEFRARVIEHKRNRSVALGPNATWSFEDRLTMQYQVQEMLRVERIFEAEAIQEELDSYNPLIPDGSQLEGDVPARVPGRRRAPRAPRAAEGRRGPLLGAGRGFERVWAIADEDLERENDEKTSVGALPALRAEPADVRAGEGGRGDRRRHRPRELSPRKWRACRTTCANRSPKDLAAERETGASVRIRAAKSWRARFVDGSKSYTASDIEVLSGLDPVRRRPGMYTDTSRPNHLAHEVVDNSVDEALSGHAKRIDVVLYKDGSLEVADDGRGMPVDIHPKEKVSGVELILTRLHAGGKFSDKNYKFAGGLHGVGVSVVNALSKNLECWVKRGGKEYNISFKDGKARSKLEVVDDVGKNNTGTTVRFWPDPQFFESVNFSLPKLKHVLRAKAVLCPGLRVTLKVEQSGEKDEWFYTGGVNEYLLAELGKGEWLPPEMFSGNVEGEQEAAEWAVAWRRRWRDARRGKLRQPDPDAAGRHARQRPARRPHRRGPRVLRVPQPAAERSEARAGRRVGRRQLRALDQAEGAAVRRARPRSGCPRASPRRSSAASSRISSATG